MPKLNQPPGRNPLLLVLLTGTSKYKTTNMRDDRSGDERRERSYHQSSSLVKRTLLFATLALVTSWHSLRFASSLVAEQLVVETWVRTDTTTSDPLLVAPKVSENTVPVVIAVRASTSTAPAQVTKAAIVEGDLSLDVTGKEPSRVATAPTTKGAVKLEVTTVKSDLAQVTSHYNFQLYYDSAPPCHDPNLGAKDIGFTLVTQLSTERLWTMQYHCQRWAHDISLAVFVGAHDPSDGPTPTVESIREDLLRFNCSSDRVTVQTVGGYSAQDYPVNVLRNTALSAVKTTHVIFVDIDFWLPLDMNEQLHRHATELATDHKLALVLPAFELKPQCKAKGPDCLEKNLAVMPTSKQHLIDLWTKEKQVDIFLSYYTPAQGSTRYNDWIQQSDDELLPLDCLESNRYEPFLVFRYCHDLPPFQNAFNGYGKNKDSWMMHTRRVGYHYKQIGGAFIVHYPHKPSKARLHFNGGPNGELIKQPTGNVTAYKRGLIALTYVAFRDWLTNTTKDETVVSLCKGAKSDNTDLWIEKPANLLDSRRKFPRRMGVTPDKV